MFAGVSFFMWMKASEQGVPPSVTPTSAPSLPAKARIDERSGPTSEWVTYVNEKYGYSIMYPSDFQLRSSEFGKSGERIGEADQKVVFFAKNSQGDWVSYVSIEVSWDNYTKVLDRDNLSFGEPQGAEVRQEKVRVGGKEGIKRTGMEVSSGGQLIRIYLPTARCTYLFSCSPNFLEEEPQFYIEYFDLMLSTFTLM
jgi:hypothetical protein